MISRNVLKFIRTYATDRKVIPPFQLFGIEGLYASALYTAAVKTNELQAVENDMIKLKKALQEDSKVKKLLSIATESSVKELVSHMNPSAPISNFLNILKEDGRLGKLEDIIKAFSILMGGHRGDLRCEITTASPLDDETKAQLQKVLKLYAKKGQNIVLELKVDPDLIGGMTALIGDHLVDMSISSKIKKYIDILIDVK